MDNNKCVIESDQYWNDTQFQLIAGSGYHLTSYGQWYDDGTPANGNGYPTKKLLLVATQFLRRAPGQRLFTLMGTIDHDMSTLFKIGCDRNYTALKSGRLCCFANDVPGFYFNNSGCLILKVERH